MILEVSPKYSMVRNNSKLMAWITEYLESRKSHECSCLREYSWWPIVIALTNHGTPEENEKDTFVNQGYCSQYRNKIAHNTATIHPLSLRTIFSIASMFLPHFFLTMKRRPVYKARIYWREKCILRLSRKIRKYSGLPTMNSWILKSHYMYYASLEITEKYHSMLILLKREWFSRRSLSRKKES